MNTQEAIEILEREVSGKLYDRHPYLDEALTYAIEIMKRGQWQPIETAPKDGTYVLVCEKDNSAIYEARFMWDDWFPAMQSDSDEYDPMKGFPSHWMPLPEPPQERKTK